MAVSRRRCGNESTATSTSRSWGRCKARWASPRVSLPSDRRTMRRMLPPPGGGNIRRIVLLSDGNETRGDAQRALQRPQLRDVEVAVLSLPQRLLDTAITSFVAPAALRDGEPAELRLATTSPLDQSAHL